MRYVLINWPRWIGVIVLAQCIGAQAGEAPAPVKLKPASRIVFLGDSATGQHGYTALVADYFALCQGELHFSFRTSSTNAIWRAADGTVNALPTVQADAIDVHPAVAIVSFGADEGDQANFGPRQFPYFSGQLGRVVRDLKQQGIAVILVTPADFSTDGNAPPGQWYGRVIEEVRAVAAREQTTLVDLNAAMRELRKQPKELNQPAVALTNGTVLAPAGHALAALLVLASLGVDVSPASLEIDAAAGKSTCHRCKIDALAVAGDHLSFSRADEALPMMLPAEAKTVAALLPGRNLNRYGLKVTGLKPGTWKLKVQDMEVGSFTADEFAAGVDLSDFPGPWRALAQSVHQKSIAIEDAFAVRCQSGSDPKIPAGAEPQRRALVEKLDARIEKLAAEQSDLTRAARNWNWSLSLDKK